MSKYEIDIEQVIRLAGGLENLLRNMGLDSEDKILSKLYEVVEICGQDINLDEVVFKDDTSKLFSLLYVIDHPDLARRAGISSITYKSKVYSFSKCYNFDDFSIYEANNSIILKYEVENKGESKIKKTLITYIDKSEIIQEPIEKKTFYYIRACPFSTGSGMVETTIDGIHDILSSQSKRFFSNYPERIHEILRAIRNIIVSISDEKIKTIGLAFLNGEFKETFEPGNYFFSEDYHYWKDMILGYSDPLSKLEREYYVIRLSKFTADHNLLVIGAFFGSLLIHDLKPNITPILFIYGDSNVGKTAISSLLSFVEVPQSTTTVHQLLQFISGFRCGLAHIDEKNVWENQLIQELKRSATNYGRISRSSKNLHYLANMIIVSTSNPTPKFKTRGLEDLKGLIRRSIFLEVSREKDRLENISYVFNSLEIDKEKLIRALIEEIKEFDIKEIKEIYNQMKEFGEKFALIFTGIKIWEKICEKYEINLSINYKELWKRLIRSEKEVLKVKDDNIVDIIKGKILEDMVGIARKIINTEIDYDNLPSNKEIVKATLDMRKYAVIEMDGKKYIVFTPHGWKNMSEDLGLPSLDTIKDISNYLKSIDVKFEVKRTSIFGKNGRWIIISLEENDCEFDIKNKIIEIIKNAETPLSAYEISEQLNVDIEEIEEILEEMKKLGDVVEVKPGKYFI